MVEVGVCGSLDIKIYVANVVESLIDKSEGKVSVIDESMWKCWWPVRQHHGVTIGWDGAGYYRIRLIVQCKFGMFHCAPTQIGLQAPCILPTRAQNLALTSDCVIWNNPIYKTTHHAKTNVLSSAPPVGNTIVATAALPTQPHSSATTSDFTSNDQFHLENLDPPPDKTVIKLALSAYKDMVSEHQWTILSNLEFFTDIIISPDLKVCKRKELLVWGAPGAGMVPHVWI